MGDPRSFIEDDHSWVGKQAKAALPVLVRLAKSRHRLTYTELNNHIAQIEGALPTKAIGRYSMVLEKIGRAINGLSDLWQEEIPPITVVIVRAHDDLPGTVADDFLQRFVTQIYNVELSKHNRATMVGRATDAVFDYGRWDEVASYFEIEIS